MLNYQPPFPWFGGKSRCAPLVWRRFGDTPNYVEPFFGAGHVLFHRPHEAKTETVNDKDGFVSNFWRATQADPEAVAQWADQPVSENDLHARHIWLRERREILVSQLEADPEYFDAKIAGWWAWGQCVWIGGGWCGESGSGPWSVVEEDGVKRLVKSEGRGVSRRLPHLGNAGKGVTRKLPHLGSAGRGVNATGKRDLTDYFLSLSERLRRVRVCCGDFERVLGPSVTVNHGLTAVFLDPPYSSNTGRDMNLYSTDCGDVAHKAREWALANGENPLLRIAICGYEGEHEMPAGWKCVEWTALGGYSNQSAKGNPNRYRERIWFSPHCLNPDIAQQILLGLTWGDR